MSYSIGIVGLPNSGKSTIFNILLGTNIAKTAPYPFSTVEPNHACIPLKDDRLEKIANSSSAKKVIPSYIDFFDIAGLVQNASKGEGLGNLFLENIRQTDAILHVVRTFESKNVPHIMSNIDPIRDIEIIETELLISDIQYLEKVIDKLKKKSARDIKVKEIYESSLRLLAHLQAGKSVLSFPELKSPQIQQLLKEITFITVKPVIICINCDENQLTGSEHIHRTIEYASKKNIPAIIIPALIYEELQKLSQEERSEFLKLYNLSEEGIMTLVKTCHNSLGLITFYTTQSSIAQAWNILSGTTALEAAGKIHTDFQKNFIKVEVIHYKDFITYGNEKNCREKGVLKIEGKNYIVQDGDILNFIHG